MKIINNKPRNVQLAAFKSSPKFRDSSLSIAHTIARKYPMKTVNIKGIKFRLYSVSWLAHSAGKTPRAVRRWEEKGMFPKPLFALSDGYRWYSAAEIKAYSRMIKAAGMKMGRLMKGQEPPLQWLKRNAFGAKEILVDLANKEIGKLPQTLDNEDELLASLAKNKKFAPTEAEILALIK